MIFGAGSGSAGEAIMRAREARNWTQETLAEKMGTHQPNIARLETGRVQASMQTLERVAEATGMRLIIDFQKPLASSNRPERASDYRGPTLRGGPRRLMPFTEVRASGSSV